MSLRKIWAGVRRMMEMAVKLTGTAELETALVLPDMTKTRTGLIVKVNTKTLSKIKVGRPSEYCSR